MNFKVGKLFSLNVRHNFIENSWLNIIQKYINIEFEKIYSTSFHRCSRTIEESLLTPSTTIPYFEMMKLG